jgi:hypothetical protein
MSLATIVAKQQKDEHDEIDTESESSVGVGCNGFVSDKLWFNHGMP